MRASRSLSWWPSLNLMRSVGKIAALIIRRARLIVAVAVAMTVLAGMIASDLSFEADLQRLLPESAPSVKGMNQLQSAYGPIGRLTLVLDGEDEAKLEAVTRKIGDALRAVEHVTRTEYLKPLEHFEGFRLLYVDLEDLHEIRDRIVKRLKWEKRRANPLFADLGSDPPEIDFEDIESKYEGADSNPFYRNELGDRYLIFVYFDFGPGDLVASKHAVERVRELAHSVIEQADAEIELEFTGRYKKRIDQTLMLEDDLKSATVLAFVLLVLFLALYFRGFVAPILVTVPLLMGTVWAFAWARIVFDSLNILTGFFGAVILGLGIDYGIHLMSRYLEARRDGEHLSDALQSMLASAGKASVFAGLTTVFAFSSLAFSHFRAFHEYGIIALGGLTLIIVAQVVVLPAFLVLVTNTTFEPRAAERPGFKRWALVGARRSMRPILMTILVILVGVSLFFALETRFETDFQKIFSTTMPSWTLDEEVDEMLELSQVPAVVLAEDVGHAGKIATEVRSRAERLPEGRTLERAMILEDLLPQQQTDKLEVLQGLKDEFDRLPSKVIKDELAELDAEIERLLDGGELETSNLPEELRKPFSRIDDPDASVVLAFPAVEMHDASDMREFAAVVRQLPSGNGQGGVDAISEAMLMVDILEYVRSDSILMIGFTLLGLFLVALLAFRNFRRISLLLSTIAVSIVVAIGMVAFFEVSFNFINVLIWPIWLGLGVDAAFHLMVRVEESPGDFAGFMSTLGAVAAAFGTSMIGFGSMMITDHSGLASLGSVAVIGLASIFVASALVQGLVFVGTLRSA